MLAVHLLQKTGDAYSRRKQDFGVDTGKRVFQKMSGMPDKGYKFMCTEIRIEWQKLHGYYAEMYSISCICLTVTSLIQKEIQAKQSLN